MRKAEIYNNMIINRVGHAVSYLHDIPTGTTHIHGQHSKSRYAGNLYWCFGKDGFDIDSCQSIKEWSIATVLEKVGEKILNN